jgi:exonuclease VII small subunit
MAEDLTERLTQLDGLEFEQQLQELDKIVSELEGLLSR